MQSELIKHLIETNMTDTIAHVDGDGAHFQAIVISPAFENKTRIQKQQMVYNTVKSHLLDGTLHALSIKAYTPNEWNEKESKGNK